MKGDVESGPNQLFGIGRTKPAEKTIGKCEACGKGDSMKSCSRCHSVTYCGRDCQVAHWKYHKSYCSYVVEKQKPIDPSVVDIHDNTKESSTNVDGKVVEKADFWNVFRQGKNDKDSTAADTETANSDSDSNSDSPRNNNGRSSETKVEEDLVNMDTFPAIYDSENKPLEVKRVMAKHQAVLSSCPATGWRLNLLDGPSGWMAPRMYQALVHTAVSLSSDQDLMVKRNSDLKVGLSLDQDLVVNDNSDLKVGQSGFLYILRKISEIMELSSHIPTAEFILKYLQEDKEWKNGAKEFFQRGGRVEHVFDYLCRAAMDSVKVGEPQEKEEASLLTTPLDYEFDLVRVMCLDHRCFDTNASILSKMEDTMKLLSWN